MGEQSKPSAFGAVDLLLRGGRVFDVFSGTFVRSDVAIAAGRIVGFSAERAHIERDVGDAWIVPGLIDAHVHIESSQLSPIEFARAVLPHGTTCVIADPHEIGNVLGLPGIRYMLDATAQIPFRAYFMAPSCVPSSPFETSGAVLGVEELREMLGWDRVLGLGEMMNYPGVLGEDPEVLAKLRSAAGRPIDGHAPGLTGPALWRYAAAGPRTDHECTTIEEAREKLRAGLRILLREGTTARNLDALLPILDATTAPFVHFCTDDRHPESLLHEGSIDDCLRRAMARGVPPEVALAAATLHPARTYGLGDLGALAPGYRADVVILSDLTSFAVDSVYVGGELAAADGAACFARIEDSAASVVRNTVRVAPAGLSFRLPVETPASRIGVRVIGASGTQVVTESLEAETLCLDGAAESDPERDVLKLAVVERHAGTGRIGIAFVQGLGLRHGAIASTVAHDAHNLVVAGCSDAAMRRAVEALAACGGGQVVVDDERVLAQLPLPIAGLMTDDALDRVAEGAAGLTRAAHDLGCPLPAPFATLSFLALPVIPHLKLTDRGLIDVDAFEIVSPIRSA